MCLIEVLGISWFRRPTLTPCALISGSEDPTFTKGGIEGRQETAGAANGVTASSLPLPHPNAESAQQKPDQCQMSQRTMGSFQSVHSNAVEKNRILFSLLEAGVETTVDRLQKNSRIINWICHGHHHIDPPPHLDGGRLMSENLVTCQGSDKPCQYSNGENETPSLP